MRNKGIIMKKKRDKSKIERFLVINNEKLTHAQKITLNKNA